jgi:hypothetical protein
MPVYLDDKDARTETIKKYLQGVNCSVSEFMAYIYMDDNGLYIDNSSVEYGELIDKIHAVHPTIELCDLVAEITDVMEAEEQEYFRGWMMNAKGLERLRQAIRSDFSEDLEESCQTGYLSTMC